MNSPRHILPAALLTCAAALAGPSLASADDFCVDGAAGCTGTAVAAKDFASTLKTAESNGTDDRFFLGAGTYDNDPLAYQSLEQVEIIGQGRDATVLRSDDPGTVLTVGGNSTSRVSNLTVQPAGDATAGLHLAGTRAESADVKSDPAGTGLQAALLISGGGKYQGGTVHLDQAHWGVLFQGSGGAVTDSKVDAPNGIGVVGTATDGEVQRSTLKTQLGAVAGSGHLDVSDTLVDIRSKNTPSIGLFASTSAGVNGTTATVDAERVTVIGSNQPALDSVGFAAEADGQGKTGAVSVKDSVISGFATSFARQGKNSGQANISTDRSVYVDNIDPSLTTGSGSVSETNRVSLSPHFVNPAADDFHLAPGSPLIDAGTPGDLPADALDRDGKPRQSDGNGDCSRVSDIGAFEFQGTSVKAVATGASAPVAQAIAFSSEGSCIPGPGAPRVTWSFDDGGTADGATAPHAFATPGRHTATATVSDADGHQATANAEVDVTPAPAQPAAPVISGLRVKGQSVRFNLSRPAKVDVRFAKVAKHGKVKSIKTRLKAGGKKGANKVLLPRKLRHLKPGSYRLTAVATAADGGTSKPAKARFKVARKAR
jgi:chitodextrinase